eukprot:TRINITY_DN25391_c0_g1_i1.p1 TRINITY_DN25391_c0_g1~~TRINITY_DN25391_c0_g1_i1.p1  ORF type:complete len:414 (+),score=85.75 TRINITY_DN25391_c0_g1_i1:130-1371(+)
MGCGGSKGGDVQEPVKERAEEEQAKKYMHQPVPPALKQAAAPPDNQLPPDAFVGFDASEFSVEEHVVNLQDGAVVEAVIALEFMGPDMDRLAYVTTNDRVPRLAPLDVRPLALSPASPGELELTDVTPAGQAAFEHALEHSSPITCMAGVRHGMCIATAAHDRQAIVWMLGDDFESLHPLIACTHSYAHVSQAFNCVALAPHKQALVASGGESLVAKSFASDDEDESSSTILIWHLAKEMVNATQPSCFDQHRSEVMCLRFDGNDTVISGSRDGVILTWNIHTRASRQRLTKHTGSILGMSCSAMSMLATMDSANLHIWNADSASCMFTLTAGDMGIPAIRGASFLTPSHLLLIGFTSTGKVLDVTRGCVLADCHLPDLALSVSLSHASGLSARVAVGCKSGSVTVFTFSNLH